MNKMFLSLLSGLIFGLGLTVSGMINPAKVLGFLDIFGDWDPSLAFVMGAAFAVSFIGYRLIMKRSKPVCEATFEIPAKKAVDKPLIIGAILFGVGWGLVGLCPGPAIAGLLVAGTPVFIFVGAMTLGMILFKRFPLRLS